MLRPPRSTPFPTRRSSDPFSSINEQDTRTRLCRISAVGFGEFPSSLLTLRSTCGLVASPPAAQRIRHENFANPTAEDRKSTRLNSSHEWISYAVFCLKKKK